MHAPEIKNLINKLSKLPGLGPRSGRRIALHLLQQPHEFLSPLLNALHEAQLAIKICKVCFNLDTLPVCGICSNQKRDHSTLCVVETVTDLWAMERSNNYSGLYFVLGGHLSAIQGIGPEQLNLKKLYQRLNSSNQIILNPHGAEAFQTSNYGPSVVQLSGTHRFAQYANHQAVDTNHEVVATNHVPIRELIFALNASIDGQTTMHYIRERIKDVVPTISTLASGIPLGGELDYLDDATLGAALAKRYAIA